jgi:hypothetical protein
MKRKNWKNITIKSLAAIISSTLEKSGVDAVLVGGACVSIYSENKYVSGDLDYVAYESVKTIKPILERIGFMQKGLNRFVHPQCEFYVELVAPPVGIGEESPVNNFNEISCNEGRIVLLTPTDCVKDRLAIFYHWHDPQALEQAIMVAKAQKVDLKEVESWSKKEGKTAVYENFLGLLKDTKCL